MKYYRVKKKTFIWHEGAIIHDQNKGQYIAIEDIWNTIPVQTNEYISAPFIEHDNNSEFFERVYPDTIGGKLFRTKDQLVDLYEKAFPCKVV